MKTVDSLSVDCDSQQPFKRLRGHGGSSPFNRKALMMVIDFIIQFFMIMVGGSIQIFSDVFFWLVLQI